MSSIFLNKFFTKLDSLRKTLFGLMAINNFFWKLINKSGINQYNSSNSSLTKHKQELLDDLKRDGIAIARVEDFSEDLFFDLTSYKEQRKIYSKKDKNKEYLHYYLGGSHHRDPPQEFDNFNPLVEFSVNSDLLNIINSYFRMFCRLIYLEINETKVLNTDSLARASQNFHRDPGVRGCIKVFVYLNDVEEGGGAFTYIRQTHTLGKYKDLFNRRFSGVGSTYPNEVELKNNIDEKNIFKVYGQAGTVIIADTTGIHKGGLSTKKSREMTTSVFYPPGEFHKSRLIFNFNFNELNLSLKQIFALRDF